MASPRRFYLVEAILMSTHNIGFYEDLTKIIFHLSSNMHLISSSGLVHVLPGQKPLRKIFLRQFSFSYVH